MEPHAPNAPATSPDLTFQVMPQDLNHPEKNTNFSSPMPPPPPRSPSGMPPKAPIGDMGLNSMPPLPESDPNSHRNILLIGGIIIVIGLIGFGLYYFLGAKKTDNKPGDQPQAVATRLPKVWLTQYFNKEACDDQSICGDNADPDNDGLSNYDEFKTGTSPIDSDSDKDGLADGDELHVYKTEPTLKYTDRREIVQQNDWTDSYQIRNGYDPLTPGKKFTDSRTQQIKADTAANPLHEPSITSLKTVTPPAPTNPTGGQSTKKSVTVTIENDKFNPATVTMSAGDSVVWLNKDGKNHHVASDPHPTHTGLAGFESPDLSGNQTYSFTFTKTGTFGYHDHLNPTIKGTVIVK
ncbi:MAG: hypothetical protein A3J07_02815 [Candidatus Doudnabacteria bacterium RIFCSPLOWO2_02_FULL_49_13]|uniref:EfeO-type cupredoxin-like domain-containing protein n=1 Tax=Candidatus Doudnabacteria bacterium RIFCSPHIGHO2_12_FULL_48_16 TaxID=1817838 RepID=A0A1F5PL65_9BACT|nr:MAG: hypothetical protein A3B77_01455 [Candidatus Doudnabacteria bacterium RIFCSPHIGHO2_02_FULL_49_24]OGE88108.1 MAG: hypothetical protein A2760_00870 [Candidatus Doudnabacteria bacterium RIFCSPHIGHO2_01_FULL_50_67]OGE90609.1 MAG: hypothetical protein A3E29_02325 [Candidatus Doudnabacteria bacterium RIFCSPHIGHO2_12_FULL_48_16]OGE96467.1 MAG: hypothetical protein A2990_04270 [Candidatus Doudnabacteria bacterium RIFCSPLOWO2_01_FULL_49_40]OGF03002.1 MAG: hypothetical protein A3J07_02815 [Candid